MYPTPVAAEMDSCDPLDVAPARPDYGGADADAKVLSDALGLHHPGLRARVLGRRAGGGGMVHLAPKEEDCGNSSVPWLDGGEFGVISPFHVVVKVEENRASTTYHLALKNPGSISCSISLVSFNPRNSIQLIELNFFANSPPLSFPLNKSEKH